MPGSPFQNSYVTELFKRGTLAPARERDREAVNYHFYGKTGSFLKRLGVFICS